MTSSYDVVGVGVGPSNLSLAALLAPYPEIRARFFERRPEFQWHPGLLFPGATIQVSFIKDLVTLADPTSRFSFLAFLKDQRRLYRFLNADFDKVDRREFNQYFKWVCGQLRSLEFGSAVKSITFEDQFFIHTGSGKVRSRHLVLGVGPVPSVPQCAKAHLGDTVFHASRYREVNPELRDKRVVVVGSGQSGAEVLENVLSNSDNLPRQLWWISRRPNFLPLDESPFVNELFTPSYARFFAALPEQMRTQLVSDQKLASDGISPRTLLRLTQRLYELQFLDVGCSGCHLWPARTLCGLAPHDGAWELDVDDLVTGGRNQVQADVVVLSTGADTRVPPCIEPLLDRLTGGEGKLRCTAEYLVDWAGSPANRIYVQNLDRTVWGIADPNLSLMAWRSARIANGLLGREVYDTWDCQPAVEWMNGAPNE